MQGRGISSEKPLKTGMAQESSVVEQAIVRALRDNLESIKRTADELHHAVNDVVSACASNKPTNALPSLLRAQTSAASLAATLEVLSRFVAVSMQTGPRSPIETQLSDLVGRVAPQAPPAPQRPAPSQPVPKAVQAPPARQTNHGSPSRLLLSLAGGNPRRRGYPRPRRLPIRLARKTSLIGRGVRTFLAIPRMPYYSVSL